MNVRVALLIALALTACSRESGDKATTVGGAAAPKASPANASDDTVPAVLASPGNAGVALRFLLGSRPVVGMPVTLRLDFQSADVISAMHGVAEGQGFVVTAPAAEFDLNLPEAGVSVSHSLTLTPQASGLLEVTVRLRLAGSEGVETVYAIPVLVAAVAAKADAAAK